VVCQSCGKADACVHLTDIIDGKKRTLVLCERCAADQGFGIDPELLKQIKPQIEKLIQPLLDPQAKTPRAESPERRMCPDCGMTWEEFRKSNRFGCPRDYEVFEEQVARLLESLHGTARHAGRQPDRVRRRLDQRRRLNALQHELGEAVRAEDFERAAALRDQILNVESDEG
jgi:protein arginine kinase activator